MTEFKTGHHRVGYLVQGLKQTWQICNY